ncbi:MAG TPA: hypothetical protein PLL58_01445 [Candidatus Syntrophosphaera sp.]|nr:hypothetical protein [Candidatus Syntrophosphaera sp.]
MFGTLFLCCQQARLSKALGHTDGLHRATLEISFVACFADAAVDAFGWVDYRLVVKHGNCARGTVDGAEAASDAFNSINPVL